MRKILIVLACLVLTLAMVTGCNDTTLPSQSESSEVQSSDVESSGEDPIVSITIVTVGWVNVPFDSAEDPFKQYLLENYGINVKVLSYTAADFEQQLPVLLASNDKPDLIAFRSITELEKYYAQGSLIANWSPYFEYAPKLVEQMMQNELALLQLGTPDGGTKALFANGEDPTWSLKVRQDWVKEYAAEKGKGDNFVLSTPDDVLDFARWIKLAKNPDQNALSVYAFSSAGGGTSIGTTLEWTQGMFGHTINGLANMPSRGFYITDDGKVSNPVIDGSYANWLEFLRTLVDEKLIDPNWFTNDWPTKGGLLFSSKFAFDWFPGVIAQEAFNRNQENPDTNNGEDTYSWFANMEVPTNGFSKYVGIPTSGRIGHLWTATVSASMDNLKMKKIANLLNDLTITYDDSRDDSGYYQRSEVYDVLRWGIGMIDGIDSYIEIPGSRLVACNIAPELSDSQSNYRADNPGAWDWGVWFSTRSDGVLQASSSDSDQLKFPIRAGELDAEVASLKQYFTPGSYLQFDQAALNRMFEEYVTFTYAYATRTSNMTIDQFITRWRTELKGDEILLEAERQYKELGFMD